MQRSFEKKVQTAVKIKHRNGCERVLEIEISKERVSCNCFKRQFQGLSKTFRQNVQKETVSEKDADLRDLKAY